MKATVRQYNFSADFEKVGRFLVRTYRESSGHVNWLQPRWEYMHYHPLIHDIDLSAIGIWEDQGDIVGVVHPEHEQGTAYFEIDPDYTNLKREMVEYAEEYLSTSTDGKRRLRVFINDEDVKFQAVVSEKKYVKSKEGDLMSCFIIPSPFPEISLQPSFRLVSLADDNDLRKVDRVLWRGFNHPGEPPEDGIEGREFMQSAPNYRKDLNIMVEAPTGEFVSYCGMWYEPVHKIAYVEPVATDPDYRQMGLGRAAVLEGIRRCGILGARIACVGSAMPFYLSMGFQQVYAISTWLREWD
jgi:predicted N-acetyltransferase YhbS